MKRLGIRAYEIGKQKLHAAKDAIKRHPYVSLTAFVMIVAIVAVLGYARYQYVQEELAAQQTALAKVQRGLNNWSDDLAKRIGDLKDGFQGTARDAGNVVGGAWGILSFVVTAVLDYLGNLHFMIPVTIIYFGVGFFGTLKMRVATLIGALIALWVATSAGIVTGSIIGLIAIVGFLFWNKIDPRLLTAVQGLPQLLKRRIQQAREGYHGRSSAATGPTDQAEDSPD